jgi:hypothetical protein
MSVLLDGVVLIVPAVNVAVLAVTVSNADGVMYVPAEFRLTERSAGYVENTFFCPAPNETLAPPALEARIVSRVRVGPVVEYVPIPTSQSPALGSNAV